MGKGWIANGMKKTDAAGIKFIKTAEGVKLKAYKDSGGVWTIGVGHIAGVRRGQVITEEEAEEFLAEDLEDAEEAVNDSVHVALNQNQFNALVSLVFNIGVNAFTKSTLVRKLNDGDYAGAADQFLRWNKDNGATIQGLTNRRRKERTLFLTPAPILNGEATGPATVATSTTTRVETAEGKTEEKTSFASSVVSADKVQEIAGTGLSTIGNKLATGGISGGVVSAIGAFLEKAWPLLIFAAVLIILGFITWWLIYNAKQKQKLVEGQIAADPTRKDITFGIGDKKAAKRPEVNQ